MWDKTCNKFFGQILFIFYLYSLLNSQHTDEAINSLAPGKFEWNFRYVIFKRILVIARWGISSEIALIWMSLDSTDDQSTLVQVMAWCRQAPSHYLSQCWPRSLLPYGVTRSQWVNLSFSVTALSSYKHTKNWQQNQDFPILLRQKTSYGKCYMVTTMDEKSTKSLTHWPKDMWK